MTDRELQMQFLMLEDSYRKLEDKVAKLEVSIQLNQMLGLQEQLNNTSISLFLLRKDRERLAKELGLDIDEYTSVKSLGESALEDLIYNCKDVITELSKKIATEVSVNTKKEINSVFSPVILDLENKNNSEKSEKTCNSKENKKVTQEIKEKDLELNESKGLESNESERTETRVLKNDDIGVEVKQNLVEDTGDLTEEKASKDRFMDLNNIGDLLGTLSMFEDKAETLESKTQTVVEQEIKTETKIDSTQDKDLVVLESHHTTSISDINSLNNGTVATDSFENLDAALNMWN